MSVLIVDNTNPEGLTPPLDLSKGAQNGAMRDPFQWTSAAPYVRQKMIAILVAAPAAMQYMANGTAQVAALKSLIEMMPKSIEGLNSTVTWEFGETPVGHAGEMMESVIKGTRARSVPAFTWDEKWGFAITRFFTELGLELMMDPELGLPGIISAPAYIAAGKPQLLPEQQAMTVLFFEPDNTMTHVTKAWLCTNMMPKQGGTWDGKRNISEGGEVLPVTIEFTALTMIGNAVNKMAKNYLDSLALKDMRPADMKPFLETISPDVERATAGYASEITNAVNAA